MQWEWCSLPENVDPEVDGGVEPGVPDDTSLARPQRLRHPPEESAHPWPDVEAKVLPHPIGLPRPRVPPSRAKIKLGEVHPVVHRLDPHERECREEEEPEKNVHERGDRNVTHCRHGRASRRTSPRCSSLEVGIAGGGRIPAGERNQLYKEIGMGICGGVKTRTNMRGLESIPPVEREN